VDADERLEVARRYVAAARAGDAEALAEVCEPDVAFWHNFDDQSIDLAATIRTLGWLGRAVPDLAWEEVALLPTSDGFVWRALITGTAPGGPLRVHTCVVATLSDRGRLASAHEYLDPAGMAPLSG
jgi:ketosteroid isomerase-like protein